MIKQEKAHKHKLLVRLVTLRPRVCPKPGLSLGQTRVFSYFTQGKPSLSQGQTQIVLGTNPGDEGRHKSLCVKGLCALFAR